MGPALLTNPLDLVIVVLFAFLVLGPKRLPEVARKLGRGIREARKSLSGLSLPEYKTEAATNPDVDAGPVEADPDPVSTITTAERGPRELDTIA